MMTTDPKPLPFMGGSVLFWKLNAEAYIGYAGVGAVVVKPCGLTDGAKGGKELTVGHNDVVDISGGVITRADVAAVMAEAVARRSRDLRFDLCVGKGAPTTDLGAVLAMEYRVAVRFMEAQQGSDFFEGVRALLVDKDNAPNWAAAPYDGPLRTLANADAGPDALAGALADALEDVADADVATYFSPLAERDGVDVGELELLQRPFTRPQGSTLPAANA